MKYIQVYTLFLVFVFHTSCGGQNQTNPPQDNAESQLKEAATPKVPRGQVRNIKHARNGDILIASFVAVFRYDGKSFTNLTGNHTSSTPGSNRLWDVLEDRRGNLWFASDSGVYYYNGKSFQHFTTREGLAHRGVMSIYEDKAGIIWFGTAGGLSRYDGKSFRNFTIKEGLSNDNITTIMEDKTGKLWIGTRGEAFVYDGKTFTTLIHEGKAVTNVWSIIEDKKGNIWLGANGGWAHGLWRYDGSVFTKVSQRGVYTVIEDKKGNIWTTGDTGGSVWALSRYDQKSLYNIKPTVTEIMSRGPVLLGLLEANDGSIWFGASDGVFRYDGKTITDFRSKEDQK